MSEGRKHWLVSELAILHCAAINVPLSTKLDADADLVFRINHSEAKIIICSVVQLAKIRIVNVITSYSIHYTKLYEILGIDEIKLLYFAKKVPDKQLMDYHSEALAFFREKLDGSKIESKYKTYSKR